MFHSYEPLNVIFISDINNILVKNMSDLFKNCISLSSIDINLFNTSNVVDMPHMFDNHNS